MSKTRVRKGPAGHRFLVMFLNILLGILVYWLLGFIIDDIGTQPGPSLTSLQEKFQNSTLVNQRAALLARTSALAQTLDAQHQEQALLQDSINGYRDSMNQLLALQKSSPFTSQSQQNLARVTQLYLDSQQLYQAHNHAIIQETTQLQRLKNTTGMIETQLNKQSQRAYEVYNTQQTRHNLMLAAIKLLVLIPLLIITVYFFKKKRQSIYLPMIIAIGIAISLKIIMVMHEHFPSRAFKYLLILALIYFVARALMGALRMVASPKPNWLLKQYREAYQKLQCAMCQYPIQPGALKFTAPRAGKNSPESDVSYLENITAYTCPSCGEKLFEKCESCGQCRHSLLVFCEHCGKEK